MSATRREALVSGIALGATLPLGRAAAASGPIRFPNGFLWGAATSSYQIEGGVGLDGRGRSIWDTYAHTPGRIANGDTGDVACDSYRRWRDDVALLAALGLKSYRFSIAWPRIQPDGKGRPLQAGLDHYARMTDALLAAGIRPMPTLYHWDLPQALEDAGGWPVRDTGARFVDYAAIVARALGDRIRHWTVFNEPKTFVQVGYWQGGHAPGRKEPAAAMRASHVVNLAYADTVRALKAIDARLAVGNALDVAPMYPATDSAADRAAASRWDVLLNHWYLVPALTGRYPDGAIPADRLHAVLGWRAGDEARLKAGYDFLGVNHYTPLRISAAPDDPEPLNLGVRVEWATAPGPGPHTKTAIGWDIYPPAFGAILRQMARLAPGVPIEITENGCADNTPPGRDGRVRDTMRTGYLRAYLAEVAGAIAAGVPVRGYHAWSLLDNFEWAAGYGQRFGIVHVDFTDPARRRRVKDSGRWFARVAKANGLVV